jgi:hypothetical protein
MENHSFMIYGSILDPGWDVILDDEVVAHCDSLQEAAETISVLRGFLSEAVTENS